MAAGDHRQADSGDDAAAVGPGVDTQEEIGNRVRDRLFAGRRAAAVRRFGRYEVVRRLGVGGMSVVYLARDPELDREVAIKALQRDMEELGEEDHRILVAEAKAMARLTHPNVVTVYDVGEQDGKLFLALERVEGVDVRQWQQQAERDWKEVVAIYVDAARGLEAAHQAGIVHRDFKPDNVLVSTSGQAKVMDFGLARVVETAEDRVAQSIGPNSETGLDDDVMGTKVRSLSGTPAYMAPERVRGQPGDAVADQFSFCVALYESLVGHRPFSGDTLVTLMTRIMAGERERIPSRLPGPKSLWAIVERGMSPEPERRFASMAALRADLQRTLVPPWRRWVWPMVGVALVASAGGGALAMRGLDHPSCEQEAARVDEVWSAERRAQVEASMLGSQLGYAPDTWARTDAGITDWVERWRTSHGEACQGREQDVLAESRRACFDAQLDHLAAVGDVLAEADPEVVERAAQLVTQLSDPSRCLDDQWLGSGVPLPVEPEARAKVLAARAKVERARLLLEVGKLEEAAELAQAQVEAAQALGERSLEAWAELSVADVLRTQTKLEQAKERALAAYVTATEVDDPRTAAAGSITLAGILGNGLVRDEEGQTWARLAQGHLARLGRGGDRLALDRLITLAHMDENAGRFDAALERIHEARRLGEATLSPEDAQRTRYLATEARIHEKRGDYERSIEVAREGLAQAERALGSAHPGLLNHLSALGTTQARRGEFDEAAATLGRAKTLAETIFGPDSGAVAAYLNNLAFPTYSQGKIDEAIELLERARTIRARELGPDHPAVARVEMNIGIMHTERGEPGQAEPLLAHALVALEAKLGPDHPEVGDLLINLGNTRVELGRYADAQVVLERALGLVEAAQGADHPKVATLLVNLTIARVKLEQYEQVLPAAERARRIIEAQLGPSSTLILTVAIPHAGALLGLGRESEAEALLREALTTPEARPDDRVEARLMLATVLWDGGRREEASALVELAEHEAPPDLPGRAKKFADWRDQHGA